MENKRRKVVEILSWLKEMGLYPTSFKREDLFVDPILGTISRWGGLRPHQKAYALWVPDPVTMRKVLSSCGISLSLTERDGVFFVELRTGNRGFSSVGVGAREAILSAINSVRLRPALVA